MGQMLVPREQHPALQGGHCLWKMRILGCLVLVSAVEEGSAKAKEEQAKKAPRFH